MLSARGDELVEHFVRLAREAGHSWTEIGKRLGVSKQAARERFEDRSTIESVAGELPPTTRLLTCLSAAGAMADPAPVRSDHQLVGLFEAGVGASILERHGLTSDRVAAAANELAGELGEAHESTYATEARRTLERAASIARRAGHDYLGTEHLLTAIVLSPGSLAHHVLERVDADIRSIKRELDQCVKPKRIPRRRRRHQGSMNCAFCEKQRRDGVRLVAGPGVCICEDCVRLAQDVIADQPLD
jgi:ATP-dependent Clp protease ATP-binding subunit ClpA